MKLATVFFVVFVLIALPVHAHEGRIMLFTDEFASDCNADLLPVNMLTVSLLYIPGDGPDMISACEFRLDNSSAGVLVGNVTWLPSAVVLGNIETGVSVALGGCIGPADPILIATIELINVSETGTFLFSIVEHPTLADPGIYTYGCAPDYLILEVLGGAFVFNGECTLDNIWHVEPDGSGEALTLQAGIDAAFDGDIVLAAPGTYQGDGNRDLDFRGKSITVISEKSYSSPGASPSIVDCQGSYSNQHRGFYFQSGEDTNSILDGFIIENGFYSRGGGIYCDTLTAPLIQNNIIRYCMSEYDGNGIYCYYSSPTITGNDIRNNSYYFGGGCADGGGISCRSSSPSITDNIIRYNGACSNGGGIFCYDGSSPHIEGNTIESNSASYGSGGGVAFENSSGTMINNTIVDNGAEGGGGIYCADSSPDIENNIVTQNSGAISASYAGGIYCVSSSPSITCCDFYDNIVPPGTESNYSGIDDQTGINGNISEDPLFCDPDSSVYTLQSDSPCLPGNHPDGDDCGLIGAKGWGCVGTIPYLSSVIDIGNDQGRQVELCWYQSSYDATGSSIPILGYDVYRRIDDLPVPPPAMMPRGDLSADDSKNREVLAYPDGDWHYILTVPAHGEEKYWVVAPTLEDSCSYNLVDYYSTFFIRAATSMPTTFFDSHPDSGYSVDNLAPCTPVGVYMTEALVLQWEDNGESDLAGYYVYGKVESSDESVRLETVYISEYDGVEASNIIDGYHFWGVSAFDFNGNESPVEEIAWIPTDVEEFDMPRADYLEQNHPNPFNPSTTIHFGLKGPSDVSLKIYDVTGRLVRVLANGHFRAGEYTRIWDGRSNSGSLVASGVYFYRIDAGTFMQTKKMILLR